MDVNADNIDIPSDTPGIVRELSERLGINDFTVQPTRDGITTLWISRQNLRAILRYLKLQAVSPYTIAVRPDGCRRASAHSPARPS